MVKTGLKQEGKAYGITLNAAGTGILLQLDEEPTCHKCELHQIRVVLELEEAEILHHQLGRLIGCLPPNAPGEPPAREKE